LDFDLENKTPNGLTKALTDLNTYLSTRSYMEGYSKSQIDTQTFLRLPAKVDSSKFAHVARWAAHIGFFTDVQRATWRVVAQPEATPAPAKAAAKAESDAEEDAAGSDNDPFGGGDAESGDDEETQKLMAENAERVKAIQARQAGKAGAAKSNITLDVKPLDSDTDMDALHAAVREVKIEGLTWLGGGFIDVAFGIRKLRIMGQIVDVMIPSADIVIEAVEEITEYVQSVDLFAFQMA